MKVASKDPLVAAAEQMEIPQEVVDAVARPAVRLVPADADRVGVSRLGGLPDLPVSAEWPRWDVAERDGRELAEALAQDERHPTPRTRQMTQSLIARGPREPLPLAFLAQLDLADLAGLSHDLPLPEAGHLFFFYELSEQPWGYSPSHRGSSRVIFAPPGAELRQAAPPPDLSPEHVLRGGPVRGTSVWTVPTQPTYEDEALLDRYYIFLELLAEAYDGTERPLHQVGGHPYQLQQDMQRSCALVSRGVDVGRRPTQSREDLDRLAADQREWRLLLQLASDDSLGWMWGDLGNLYWWMREEDIRAGRWDAGWFQLQCH